MADKARAHAHGGHYAFTVVPTHAGIPRVVIYSNRVQFTIISIRDWKATINQLTTDPAVQQRPGSRLK
jgi:hypothetical protein